MTFIKVGRIIATALFVSCASAAIYTGLSTQDFVSWASHIQGTVAAIHGGGAEIDIRPVNDTIIRVTQPTRSHVAPGDTVDLLAKIIPGARTEYRLNDDHALWSPMWTWIEAALAALLAAIYGEQLLTDPLSIIGFKSWRLGKRE